MCLLHLRQACASLVGEALAHWAFTPSGRIAASRQLVAHSMRSASVSGGILMLQALDRRWC